jgi:hypothetical protein
VAVMVAGVRVQVCPGRRLLSVLGMIGGPHAST